MPFFTQSRFPYLWLFAQNLIGGTKDKQKIACSAWTGQKRILEIGCSVGNIADAFTYLPNIEYAGVDIDSSVIKVAQNRFSKKNNFSFYNMSVEQHAKTGKKYDYILVAGMLHHVDDQTAISILHSTKNLSTDRTNIVIFDPDTLRPEDNIVFHYFYKLEQGKYLRSYHNLKQLIQDAGLQINASETLPIRPGFPGLPVVARFSRFVAYWEKT